MDEELKLKLKVDEELMKLRDRVIIGNDKLWKAWLQIREMDGEQREEQLDKWSEAQKKLHLLCQELKLKGYTDCLYLIDGKKMKNCLDNPDGFWCQVCPSVKTYWEDELMSLPSNSGK